MSAPYLHLHKSSYITINIFCVQSVFKVGGSIGDCSRLRFIGKLAKFLPIYHRGLYLSWTTLKVFLVIHFSRIVDFLL